MSQKKFGKSIGETFILEESFYRFICLIADGNFAELPQKAKRAEITAAISSGELLCK